MPKINVYLPDDLAAAVRTAGVPVSAVCQRALADAVAASDGGAHVDDEDAVPALEGVPAAALSRLTNRARTVVGHAASTAHQARRDPDASDVLAGIVAEGHNLAIAVLAGLDVEADDLTAELGDRSAAGSAKAAKADRTSASLTEVLALAATEALRMGHNYVGCEHLLLAVASGGDDDHAARTLHTLGVDIGTARQAVTVALTSVKYAQANLGLAGLSAPVRSALDEIRQRLARLERTP